MAQKANLVIEQGSKYVQFIQVINADGSVKDLTGYSARMEVRPNAASDTVLLSASTDTGEISINAPGGIVTITIGAAATTLLDWNTGVYDIEVYTVDPEEVLRILEGNIALSHEVTR